MFILGDRILKLFLNFILLFNLLSSSLFSLTLQESVVEVMNTNPIVAERLKKQHYTKLSSNNYFWRTYTQQELDWLEERDGKLFAYEFKWGKPAPAPKLWKQTYPDASFECINQSNYLDFIS